MVTTSVFRNWKLLCAISAEALSMKASSIYEQTLGPSFTALAPVLKRLHGPGIRRLSGDFRLRAGPHPLAPPLLWLSGLPGTQAKAACQLCLVPNQQGECWQRYFGRWKFITRQRPALSNSANAEAQATRREILERFGPFTVHLRLQVKGQSLWIRSRSTSLFGMAVPASLGIKVVAYERPIDEHSFYCDIQIRLPWVGRLLRYRGTLRFQPLSGA
jgi:hypothetical protein